jgi:hypothetical protein
VQDSLIEKYLEKKRNELMQYALVLYKLYPIDEESIWKSDDAYNAILSNIIDIYIKKYYLRSFKELNALNNNNYTEDQFKLAISLAIIADAYNEKYNEIKEKYKKGLYDLTIIVYLITNIDKEVNFLQKEDLSTNNIVNKIQKFFSIIDQDKIVTKNPFIINNLANKIKDNVNLERKFFEHLEDKDSYNIFAKYDDNSYFVNYKYNNELLDKYKEVDVERVYDKYNIANDYLKISYELASITLLKFYITGRNVPTLLLPINYEYLKNSKNIDLIKTIFSNVFIKSKIRFSIFYSDYEKNYEKFNILKELGFASVLFMDKDQMILDYSNIKLDLVIYAKDKFLENNPKFSEFTGKENIPYYVVNKNEYISEQELLERYLKED